jgi:hypothetical protein
MSYARALIREQDAARPPGEGVDGDDAVDPVESVVRRRETGDAAEVVDDEDDVTQVERVDQRSDHPDRRRHRLVRGVDARRMAGDCRWPRLP